jgi:hypothetical protein
MQIRRKQTAGGACGESALAHRYTTEARFDIWFWSIAEVEQLRTHAGHLRSGQVQLARGSKAHHSRTVDRDEIGHLRIGSAGNGCRSAPTEAIILQSRQAATDQNP